MPQTTARIFARVMDWADPSGTHVDGMEQIRLEWSTLDVARKKGKFTKTYSVTTKNKLSADIVDALVMELNQLFPTMNYTDRDVVLWGA